MIDVNQWRKIRNTKDYVDGNDFYEMFEQFARIFNPCGIDLQCNIDRFSKDHLPLQVYQ